MHRQHPTTALLALILTACGSGSDAPCVPLPIVRVQLFGDSTQAGRSGGSPAVLLQAYLDTHVAKGATVVTSRAVPGSDAGQLIAGADGLNKPWPQSVDADVVVVNHGINDAARHTQAEYRASLRTFAATHGMIFETPNYTPIRPAVRDYARIMREEAPGPVADVFAYTDGKPPADFPDGVHPTVKLTQDIVQDVLGPAVAAKARMLRCE